MLYRAHPDRPESPTRGSCRVLVGPSALWNWQAEFRGLVHRTPPAASVAAGTDFMPHRW